ncbi:hypothetical protein DKX38_019103 [Salix brachista]|uniref:F-box domain-containing protein n=1 Tax=Salix brachista TaxID=2182728 RepID=A0A5N5KQ01_9ROSI|nr:hypothetical protein DKX38_019103 [Salix brachista]
MSVKCPRLRRLVLPARNRVETVMIEAIDLLKDLESLTMPSIVNSPLLVQAIATNCRNFRHIDLHLGESAMPGSAQHIALPFSRSPANSCIETQHPDINYGSQNSDKDEDTNQSNKITNSHKSCYNIGETLCNSVFLLPAPRRIVRQLDKTILEKASWLRKFLTCMRDTCIMCQRTRNDEGLMRWYKYDEGLWKEDEEQNKTMLKEVTQAFCLFYVSCGDKKPNSG